jgi:hypothetical protein
MFGSCMPNEWLSMHANTLSLSRGTAARIRDGQAQDEVVDVHM